MNNLDKVKFVDYLKELYKDVNKILNINYLNNDGKIHFYSQLEILSLIMKDIDNGKFDV